MKEDRVTRLALGFLMFLILFAPHSVSAQENGDYYTREQLAQMLAPVALYPDALLSQVLMAATYPLEVVEADRWVKRNPMLSGANLDEALLDRDWDASVKALCQVPTVLGLMSERLDETTNLGNAFLAQESEVMDVIQELRRHAYAQGNLRSNDKLKVIVKGDGTIVIAPADPQIVYVPYYDTRYVYGSWWYPAWPPWYWGPGGVVVGSSIYFWPDYYVGFGFGFGFWSYFDWPGRVIVIDVRRRPRFIRHNFDWKAHRGRWHHEPQHRRGVVYRDRRTAEKFGQWRGRVYDRATRGYPGPERNFRRGGERRPANITHGPVTSSGGTTAGGAAGRGGTERVRTGTEQQRREVARPRDGNRDRRAESNANVITRPSPQAPVRQERAPAVQRAPVPSPPVVERARPVPEQRREAFGRREAPSRERVTIFGGVENGREENRSSIRGRESRGFGRGQSQGRGSSSYERREERGGGGGRSRR